MARPPIYRESLSDRQKVSIGQPWNIERRLVALIGPGPLPRIMVNYLVDRYGPVVVLEETKEPMKVFLKRRIKLLGMWSTAWQTAFGIYSKFAGKSSAARKQQIIKEHGLSTDLPGACTRIPVGSANSDFCHEALAALKPKAVFVVGTRMLSKKTLGATPATFLNYHAGINPSYRGMNGGYWSLANDDPDNYGATMHVIDAGVDTGDILYQTRTTPASNDNIHTYPFLLAAHARDIAIASVEDALDENLRPKKVALTSKQWFHPTLYGYFWTGLRKGVW